MDILQVTPRYPPQSGGIETHVKEISERLVDRGHNVTVLTADAGDGGTHRECRNGVHVRRYQSISPNNTIHFCPQILAAVWNYDSDIVHAHNYHSFPLFFAALGVGERPFVATAHYHGESASPTRNRLLSLYRPFGRYAVRAADKLIAVSEWEATQLTADFGTDAMVIPNGLNTERFTEIKKEERDRPYLLCVGRLEKYKGIQHVIRALPKLADYELVVAGSGPHRDWLEQIAVEGGVEARVSFLGYVDDQRLPRLYAGAELFLNLSEFEAYGMTVGEALASGTPCVVLTSTALTDWTQEDRCVGINHRTPEVVAEAIEKTIGEAAVETDLKSWNDVMTAHISIYKELVNQTDS